MESHSSVLITGGSGFTGKHLFRCLSDAGYKVFNLKANLLDREKVLQEVQDLRPNFVVHLAAISFAAHDIAEEIYGANVVGSINLLDGLKNISADIQNVILASSAAVYGNSVGGALSEDICPKPINHYGCSKLSMECLAQEYSEALNITLARPFNYTGKGHDSKFVIPKIVGAFKRNARQIELGNINVAREFNDVRDVCTIYRKMMESDDLAGVVNVCSGRKVYLRNVIEILEDISGRRIEVLTNPDFVRKNEIDVLIGDPDLFNKSVDFHWAYSLEDTLRWMYRD